MGEDLSKQIILLKSDIELINGSLDNQLIDLKKKMFEELNKSDSNILRNFEESLKRLEKNETNTQNSLKEFALFKIDNSEKLGDLQNSFSFEINEIRKEITNNSYVLENLEKKLNENMQIINKEIFDLIKDINQIKIEIESVKNFKENTLVNFKDIGDEFLKNEEIINKTTYNVNLQIRDFESKILNFEQTFNLQTNSFANVKKDIYQQIYDSSLNINNKFQMFNDKIYEKFESFDKIFNDFQSNLMVKFNNIFLKFIFKINILG